MKTMNDEFDCITDIMGSFGEAVRVAYPQTLVDYSRFDSDWKAGVHTPRLASVEGTTTKKVVNRSSDRGMESRQYNKFPIQRRYLGACPEVFHFEKPFCQNGFSRQVCWIKPNSGCSRARALTAGGYLVHVLVTGCQHMRRKSVTISHGEGTAWDYICIHSTGGGLNPTQYPGQAMFVKDTVKGGKKYIFRGVYEADIACSDEFKITYRRIADEVEETDKDWRIDRFV
jgi:hypothetical protein